VLAAILIRSLVLLFGIVLGAKAQAHLVDLIAKTKPSVVIVGTISPTDSPRFNLRAAGFVVGDGTTVVTNAHVLPEAPSSGTVVRQLAVRVADPTGRVEVRAANLVSVDRNRDLAILRIEGPPLPALRLGGAVYVAEGTEVAFIGKIEIKF
jgi:hypothetical protein